MTAATLLTFALACFALALTPGPDMIFVMTRSLAQGRVAGLVSLLGIMAGCYFHALLAGLSLSGALVLSPLLFDGMRWAGAAYLLWLGLQAWRGKAGLPVASRVPGPKLSLGRLCWQGLMCNLLNPKVALFFLALFPQFMQPDPETALAQALILATLLNLAGLIVNGGVALAAGFAGEWLSRRPGFVKWQNRLLGGVFAALALRLVLDQRR